MADVVRLLWEFILDCLRSPEQLRAEIPFFASPAISQLLRPQSGFKMLSRGVMAGNVRKRRASFWRLEIDPDPRTGWLWPQSSENQSAGGFPQ
jgi:hypothetical protein